MLKNNKISVVVPCHNEETQIESVVKGIPEYIDKIILIDDKSTDRTVSIINRLKIENKKIVSIFHSENQGVGGAIASGYMWSRDNNIDVSVVMAGDNQMDPKDLPAILDPIIYGDVDYSKGNRLFSGEAYKKIPTMRYLGNSLLSFFTKIASGYWHIADSQSGYTAINKKMLNTINWHDMYKNYGQPNDLLVSLNINNAKVRDVHIEPVYGVGEKSGIKIYKVIFTIGWLLLKSFFRRMKQKYIIRDFHALILFYILGIIFMICTFGLTIRLGIKWYQDGYVPAITALATMFSFMSSSIFTLFAMWFDMESNKHLK